MAQTWLVTLDSFADGIDLPHPVMAVASVAYLDQAGATRALDAGAYRLRVGQYQTTMRAAPGVVWPSAFTDPEAVTVTVICGFGVDASSTPPNLRLYILAKLVEQFDPASQTQRDVSTDTAQAKFLERLLDAHRTFA